MRGLSLGVEYASQDRFNSVARQNGKLTSNPGIETPLYCLIKSRLEINTPDQFTRMFKPQARQINLIWIPGTMRKSDSHKEFHSQQNRDEYYAFLFNTAVDNGRVVIAYNSEEYRSVIGQGNIMLRDDFTFTRVDGVEGLVLTNFSIRRPNFLGTYQLNPPIPKEEYWRERLLGIWDQKASRGS